MYNVRVQLTRIVVTLAVAAASLAAQAPDPAVKIVSPDEGAYVSGPVMLRALVDPPTGFKQIQHVGFLADGRLVCQVAQPPYECAWDAGEGIKEHQVRAVATLKSGTRVFDTVRTKAVAFADHVEVDMVQVTATVTDGKRFITGLSSSSFRVFEDDVPQKISYFGSEQTPLEVIVAVDISGSMGNSMVPLKASVNKFLDALKPEDRVTTLAFNDNVFQVSRPDTSPATRAKALARLQAWGGTALYDVILKSLQMLGRQQGRRALVIFTDGEDQSSHTPIDNVIRAVEASDATVYVIGQGRGTSTETLKQIQERLARVSGGRAFHTTDMQELETAFAEIVQELSNQYLLAYAPSNNKKDNTYRRIRVELAQGGHSVRARQGYRAGGGSSQ
jgi:Ca-activated chloride channel family protein